MIKLRKTLTTEYKMFCSQVKRRHGIDDVQEQAIVKLKRFIHLRFTCRSGNSDKFVILSLHSKH